MQERPNVSASTSSWLTTKVQCLPLKVGKNKGPTKKESPPQPVPTPEMTVEKWGEPLWLEHVSA